MKNVVSLFFGVFTCSWNDRFPGVTQFEKTAEWIVPPACEVFGTLSPCPPNPENVAAASTPLVTGPAPTTPVTVKMVPAGRGFEFTSRKVNTNAQRLAPDALGPLVLERKGSDPEKVITAEDRTSARPH